MAQLVDTEWLAARLDAPNVKVVDATWSMPGDAAKLPSGFIPGAVYFDIDEIAAPHASLKHMFPSADLFSQAASDMGISNDDHVICYDRHGLFSAPRVWWTFRMFGHEKVSVLDGGLPAWIKAGHKVQAEESSPSKTDYVAKMTNKAPISFDGICENPKQAQIIDARPAGRFTAEQPEPRAGLRGGHIPGSFSLPFGAQRTQDGHLKSKDELKAAVKTAGIDLNKPMITTCGSGITAAGLVFILEYLGASTPELYDGSWAEYGASNAPIATGAVT